jgi:hypothetical protein
MCFLILDLFSDINMATILSLPVRRQQQQQPPSTTFIGADNFYAHFGYVSFANYQWEKVAQQEKPPRYILSH